MENTNQPNSSFEKCFNIMHAKPKYLFISPDKMWFLAKMLVELDVFKPG